MQRPSTTVTRFRSRRLVFLTLLGVLLLLSLAQAVPALAASEKFDGGPIVADTATMVANDHTVYALRFQNETASAYSPIPDGTYYVKIRLTPNADGSPAGVDNRGFTWNESSGRWVQEREDWTLFPTVTVTEGLTGQSDWLYYKFGDTTKSATNYRVLISLSTGTAGTTRNSAETIEVAVFDPATGGGWVHPGVTNVPNAGKTGKVVDHATKADLIALQRIEANSCDDDQNGVVDDEQYGPERLGSFDMAAPTGQLLQVQAGGSKPVDWPDSTGFTITTPDTDIAVGAADQTAPTAATAPAATAQDAGAVISWTAATDATGVAGYHVYRWTDAPVGAGYTPMPVKVGTVTTGTSYTDTGLTNGTTYHYLVRAFDAATNVGPRSTTVDATPMGVSTLTLGATPATVKWGQRWTLAGTLTSGGAAVPDATVKLAQSLNGGSTWTTLLTLSPKAGTSTYGGTIAAPLQKSLYKLVFEGDAAHAAGESTPVTVTPRVKLGTPVAPRVVKKNKRFTVYGNLIPKQSSGSKTVKIRCYQKKSGAWKLRKTVTATNRNYKSDSRYSAKFSLAAKGQWRLVAYSRATAKFAATTSTARVLRVR